MAQVIMDHGVSWCFGTSLAPVVACLPFCTRFSKAISTTPFSGSLFLNSMKSARRLAIDAVSSSISSAVGVSEPVSAPRFLLKQNTGSPFLTSHRECRISFLFSAVFSTLFRIPRNTFLSLSLSMRCLALERSFSIRCLVGRSLVRILPRAGFWFQTSQLNSSRRKWSNEKRIANLPIAISYDLSNFSCSSSCFSIRALVTACLGSSWLIGVVGSFEGIPVYVRKLSRMEIHCNGSRGRRRYR
jgi:hypothetical protein